MTFGGILRDLEQTGNKVEVDLMFLDELVSMSDDLCFVVFKCSLRQFFALCFIHAVRYGFGAFRYRASYLKLTRQFFLFRLGSLDMLQIKLNLRD